MKYQKFIVFVSILISVTGILVMIGWLDNISLFRSVVATYVPMRFTSGICFILSGISLSFTVFRKNKASAWLSTATALAVLIIGVLELYQKLFNFDSANAQVFDASIHISATNLLFPGTMSQLAAACFILSGAALLGIRSQNKRIQNLTQILLHLVTILSFVIVMEYFLGSKVYYKLSFFATMAVHTAIAFFFFSIAASLVNPQLGITGLFAGTKIGNKMARSLFFRFTVTILILTYFRLTLLRENLVPAEFGIAIFALFIILANLILIATASGELNRIEQKKLEIEANLIERQLHEDGLQKSREQFLTFFNLSPAATIIATYSDRKIWYANEAFFNLFSYDKSIIGKTVYEINLLDKDIGAQIRTQVEKGQMKLKSFETKLNDGNGKGRNILLSTEKIDFENIEYIISTILDITERIETEAKLKEISDRLTLATQNSFIGIWSYDVVKDILVWDEIVYKMYGVTKDDFMGNYEYWRSKIHPEDHELVEKEFHKSLANNEELDFEFRIIWPDKSLHYIKTKGIIQQDTNGNAISMLGTNWDVTAQKLAEAEIRKVSDRLTLATQNSLIGIWDFDAVNNTMIFDDIMYKLYGTCRENIPDAFDVWRLTLHPEDIEFTERRIARAVSGEEELDFEFRIIWPDKSLHYIKTKGIVQRDTNGNAVSILGTNWDVTAQKLAEEELKQSNQRNRIFVEQVPVALAMFDNNIQYMAASRQWLMQYQLSNKEIIGRSHYEIFPEINNEYWKKIHQDCLQGAVNQSDGSPIDRADGTVQWISWDIRPWYLSEKTIGGLLMYTADITLIKEKEKEKRRIEAILNETNEVARIGTWDIDLVAGTLIWSEMTKKIHEVAPDFKPDILTAINFYKPGESQSKIQQLIAVALEKGTPFDIEAELITAKGNTLWARVIGQVEFENGKATRLYGMFQDINERKRSERIIAEERQLLKTVVDNLPVNVYIKDQAFRKILVNRRECEFVGKEEKDLLGKSDFDLYPYATAIHSSAEDRQVFETGNPIEFREILTYKDDGPGTWLLTSKVPLRNENNKITGLLGIGFDITIRKQAEEHISRLLNEMQSIMDATTAVAIMSTDTRGVITHFNKGAERLLGYAAEELIGKAKPIIFHIKSEVIKRAEELSSLYGWQIKNNDVFTDMARNGHYEPREWTYRRKDGSVFPVQLIITTVKNEKDEVVGFLGVATDLTERKESEKKMINYSILESKSKEMEQFAYIASHDLREPLLTIKNYIELLLEDYESLLDETGKKYTQSITRAANRMDALISGLLDYSKLSKIKKLQLLDCNNIINEVKEDLDSLIQTNQATIVADKLPLLQGYPLELKLLFQNLISNAIKFKRQSIAPEIVIEAKKVNSGWQFSVKDNGIGIAENDREKIFILFQRLHNRGEYEGTGIGLSHCKKIVELHNGQIWVESEPGLSSTFYFTILTENL